MDAVHRRQEFGQALADRRWAAPEVARGEGSGTGRFIGEEGHQRVDLVRSGKEDPGRGVVPRIGRAIRAGRPLLPGRDRGRDPVGATLDCGAPGAFRPRACGEGDVVGPAPTIAPPVATSSGPAPITKPTAAAGALPGGVVVVVPRIAPAGAGGDGEAVAAPASTRSG